MIDQVLLDRACAEWSRGEYYEAHETLEDVAESVEDDDEAHPIVIALVHVAACLHKLRADVGARAVPGKLAGALEVLRAAPPSWAGLDLGRLTTGLEDLARRIAPLLQGVSVPLGELPGLQRGK